MHAHPVCMATIKTSRPKSAPSAWALARLGRYAPQRRTPLNVYTCASRIEPPEHIPSHLHTLYSAHISHTLPRVAACTEGTYCPRGSAAGTFCPPGTFTKGTNLTSADASPTPSARLAHASRTPCVHASVRRSRPTPIAACCVAGPIRSARAAPLDTIAWAARRTNAASRRTTRFLRCPCRRPACSALPIL